MTDYVLARRPPTESFDVETLEGYATLVCAGFKRGPDDRGLYKQDLSPIPTSEMLAYVYDRSKRGTFLVFFFNLAFDVAAILKQHLTTMTEEQLRTFRRTRQLEIGEFKIRYIVNKGLEIRSIPDKRVVRCYDIGMLLFDKSGLGSLEALAEKHLGKGKLTGLDKRRINENPAYWREHLNEIIEYCHRDAELTKELTSKLIDYSFDVLGFYPRYYYSKGSLAKAWLHIHHSNLSRQFMHVWRSLNGEKSWQSRLGLTVEDLEFIYQCYWGGQMDTRTFGHIEHVSKVDLTSAYAYAISKLPKLDGLEMRHSGSYDSSAVTGFYRIKMRYGKYPMPYREKLSFGGIEETEEGEILHEQILYPETDESFVQFTTKPKLDFFRSRGIKFQVLDSLQWYGEPRLEFEDIPNLFMKRLDLQMQRDATTDEQRKRELDFRQYLVKLVLSSNYGAMAQMRKGLGEFTNLIYAALITSMTDVQIYEQMERVGFDDVIAIATDGLMYRERGQQFTTGFMLGNWKKEFENCTATIYQNGVYFVEDANEKVVEFRKRGMPTLTVDQLKKARGGTLVLRWLKPYRLLQALASTENPQANVRKIGCWLPYETRLNLQDVCQKRIVPAPWTFHRFSTEEVPSEPVYDLLEPSSLQTLPKPRN
jgi:hypothetical protein